MLEQPHLQVEHLVGADVGGVGGNLLRLVGAATGMVGDDGVGFRPGVAQVIPVVAFGQDVVGIEQYAFGAGSHDVVDEGDETVDVFLLVDYVLHQRVDFAVDKRIELEGIGMLPVGERGVVLADDAGTGGQPVAAPHAPQCPA